MKCAEEKQTCARIHRVRPELSRQRCRWKGKEQTSLDSSNSCPISGVNPPVDDLSYASNHIRHTVPPDNIWTVCTLKKKCQQKCDKDSMYVSGFYSLHACSRSTAHEKLMLAGETEGVLLVESWDRQKTGIYKGVLETNLRSATNSNTDSWVHNQIYAYFLQRTASNDFHHIGAVVIVRRCICLKWENVSTHQI